AIIAVFYCVLSTFFFSSRRRHTRFSRDWSSDVCSSDLYMYMADVVTDPRWQRTYGTFGEDPEFISDVIGRIIDEFQGEELGKNRSEERRVGKECRARWGWYQ